MARRVFLNIDGYGQRYLSNVDKTSIEWITGVYTFFSGITSGGGNNFTIPYQAGQELFDKYSPHIIGGSLAADVEDTETYCCPFVAFGAITWPQISPHGGGIGNAYEVDSLMPAHIGRVRNSDTHRAFVYQSGDGYYHEIFVLLAFSQDNGFGVPTHYIYFVYSDEATGQWTQVPAADLGLPAAAEQFDMWLPTSINVGSSRWSNFLVQDNDKLLSGSGSGGGTSGQIKNENTILNANQADGTLPFATIDITNVPIVPKVIMGFWDGIEVSVEVSDPLVGGTNIDILLDFTDPGFPANTPCYWHGSAFGPLASLLGDCIVGDIIRLYWITT